MADPRFFTNAGSLTLAQISGFSGAELQNSEEAGYIVEGVAGLDQAGPNQLSFLDNPKFSQGGMKFRTSGSTGEPFEVSVSENAWIVEQAVIWRHWL